MRQLIPFLFFLAIGSFSFGQDLGIQHYQRKSTAFPFAFPGEHFSAEGLMITFPDSLYNFGDVRIKKAHFDASVLRNYFLQFKSDTVISVLFTLSGKRNTKAFVSYMSAKTAHFAASFDRARQGESTSIELIDGKTVHVSVSKKGRKEILVFTTQQAKL